MGLSLHKTQEYTHYEKATFFIAACMCAFIFLLRGDEPKPEPEEFPLLYTDNLERDDPFYKYNYTFYSEQLYDTVYREDNKWHPVTVYLKLVLEVFIAGVRLSEPYNTGLMKLYFQTNEQPYYLYTFVYIYNTTHF